MGSDFASRRRWFPSRLLLGQEGRKTLGFQLFEAAAVLLPMPLFFLGHVLHARWKYHRNVRNGLSLAASSRAAPVAAAAGAPPQGGPAAPTTVTATPLLQQPLVAAASPGLLAGDGAEQLNAQPAPLEPLR